MEYTDEYNIAVQWLNKNPIKMDKNGKPIINNDRIEIERLCHQYYYGVTAKVELKNKMISMGLM
jgi:hypothetical protein